MNCFTFVYKYLQNNGVNVPTRWGIYNEKDMRLFMVEYKFFLDNKLHYKFFESFCSYVGEAQENDIIIDDNGVAVAVNKFKCYGLLHGHKEPFLMDIKKTQKIMRSN